MKNRLITALTASALLTAGAAFAAAAPVKSDIPADLAKEAKISLETARATALAKVPHGVVRSEELEREHGKLIYSFDIAVSGKSGIQEVNVSAIDGKVLGVHHETAKDEKKEAAKEHKPSGR
jgi:uncharacterized membrane protein YkoI